MQDLGINLEFSNQSSETEIINRLEALFENNDIFIFIDAVDEWSKPDKVELLNRFVSIISRKNIKLIISCKTNSWGDFLRQRGVPTDISQEVFINPEDENGYYLKPLTDEEFYKTIDNYRKFYGFSGLFESKVLDECKRSPFLLRVLFEVAIKFQIKHLTFSSKEFFDEYYKLTIEKTGSEEIADATLKAVAECIYTENKDFIEFSLLREKLRLGINDIILPELFDYSILEIIEEGTDRKVRFYFEKLRNYIISFHTKKWQLVDVETFRKEYREAMIVGVQHEAICFFYEFADIDKKKVIDHYLRDNAEQYLDCYIKIVDEHFSSIKKRFSPYPDGDIGFISEISIINNLFGFFGFRKLDNSSDRIKFLPVDSFFHERDNNILHIFGAGRIHLIPSLIENKNKRDSVIKHEIEDQLKKIIDEGDLDESQNRYLLIEKALLIYYMLISRHRERYNFGLRNYKEISRLFPIQLNDIKNAIKFEVAYDYYQRRVFDEKAQQSASKDSRGKTIIHKHYSYSNEDFKWIYEKANEAVDEDIKLVDYVRHIDLKNLEDTTLETIALLEAMGINEINEEIVPEEDTGTFNNYEWNNYKPNTLNTYIAKLYEWFLNEYKLIIEKNFPTLKNQFELYSKMPLTFFMHRFKRNGDEHPEFWGYSCKKSGTGLNNVVFCSQDDVKMDHTKWTFSFKGQPYDIDYCTSFGASEFFTGDKTYSKLNTSSNRNVLRNLVYSEIERELDGVIEAFYNL